MSLFREAIYFVVLFTIALCRMLPSSRSFHDIRAHLEMHYVIPDVIQVPPKYACEIRYVGGLVVDLGKQLYPSQVRVMPYLVHWPIEKDAYYTLIMTDPDYPARKKHKQREFQHWVVVNIPETGVLAGDTITEYYSPNPAEKTGLHRYVFTIFKQQQGKINCTERPIPEKQADYRGRFRTMKFAEKYGLGDPLAANLFQAEYTPEVAQTPAYHLTTVSFWGSIPPSTRMPRPIDI